MSERSLTGRGNRTVDPGQERKLALLHCCSPDAPSRAEQRRAKIVETARALFAEHGFHGTGIAQIASESGVKVGQLYRDFPAKEAIVAAIVERDLVEFLGESDLRRAIAAGDLAEVRRWIGGFVCGRDKEHSRLYPEICAEAARNERIGAIMDGIEQRVRGDLLLALSAFAPEGKEAVAVAADLILTLKIGIANQMTVRPDRDISALCTRVEALIDAEIEGLRSA